jgi:hypothetical protein
MFIMVDAIAVLFPTFAFVGICILSVFAYRFIKQSQSSSLTQLAEGMPCFFQLSKHDYDDLGVIDDIPMPAYPPRALQASYLRSVYTGPY